MTEHPQTKVNLTVDLKHNLIRLHKSTLHLLGDPPYIQLLINPSSRIVALKASSGNSPGDSVHRVSRKRLHSTRSVEIYSISFTQRLTSVISELKEGHRYRMCGEIILPEKLALFSFDSLNEFPEVTS